MAVMSKALWHSIKWFGFFVTQKECKIVVLQLVRKGLMRITFPQELVSINMSFTRIPGRKTVHN